VLAGHARAFQLGSWVSVALLAPSFTIPDAIGLVGGGLRSAGGAPIRHTEEVSETPQLPPLPDPPPGDGTRGQTSRIELVPRGKAALVASESTLWIDAPTVLREPWRLGLDMLAEVAWFSVTRAVFRAELGRPEGPDDSPVMIDLSGGDAHAQIRFRRPTHVPFHQGRSLWPRTVIMWSPPNPGSPRILFPPETVRHGLATSLSFRGVDDTIQVKRTLEAAGLKFPEFGDPS
jgi:hypothetical protein